MEAIVTILVPLAVYLCLCWYLANQFYEAAQAKGYSDKKYFWISFWLGIVGYLLIIALPDRGNQMTSGSMYMPDQGNNTTVIYDDLPDL